MVELNKNFEDITQQQKVALLNSVGSIQYLEKIAHEAFQDKGGVLWQELQFLLFSINQRLMERGFALGTIGSKVDWNIRNTIERVEQQYLSLDIQIPTEMTDPDEFLDWLKNTVITNHRVNHHKLFDYFDADDLSEEEVRYFLANYRVNMQRFHLHVAAYSLIVPFEMREELYDNLHDEFGEGNFEQAHPNLFEPLMDHFGGATDADMNATTASLLNTKINLCWFADGLHHGMGGMGALELSIPLQQKRVLAHLRRRGLSESLVKFFVVHCELDEDHGDGWFAAGRPYMNKPEEFQTVLSAAIRMLDARARVYDGVLEHIVNSRKAAVNIAAGKSTTIV